MKYNYLNDSIFLAELDKQPHKEKSLKLIMLDWQEQPIYEFTGQALGGSINIDGASCMRRTANLNILIPEQDRNNLSLFAINKKVSIEIGIKNETPYYLDNDIFWFPMGIYVITQKSINTTLQGTNVSLQLKDKMCLLNGECGGVLPAAVNFSEIETFNSKGQVIISHPTLFQIIQEVVNHFGGEQLGKILINDLDTRIKKVMKWIGMSPLYCFKEYDKVTQENNAIDFTLDKNKIINYKPCLTFDELSLATENAYITYTSGQDIGYIYTDFIYPGKDLIGEAGQSICDILEQIKQLLGNYEYFYDLQGNFVFQEIKNYLNTSHSTTLQNINYAVDQTQGDAIYQFNDSTLISAYSNNPNYNMIKNDFLVWGQKKDVNGNKFPIRYHLAIDKKPLDGNTYQVIKYKDPNDNLIKAKSPKIVDKLPNKGIPGVFYILKQDKENNTGITYEWDNSTNIFIQLKETYKLQNITTNDWRTELYLQGVQAEPLAINSNDYYVELKNEWPKLYDIWSAEPQFKDYINKTPNNTDFFLDIIDTTTKIGEFSVQNIGRRSKVVVDDKINCIFAPEIPDIILIQAGQEDTSFLRQECINKGQRYIQISSDIFKLLAGGGHWNSAHNMIKNLLYQYTSYNETVSLQTVPIYHLDVNTCIDILNNMSEIAGNYMITNLSIPLDNSNNISISAIKRINKI